MAENETISNDTTDNNGSLSIADKAEDLAASIKASREYQDYIAAYNKLSHDEIEKLRSFKQTEAQIPAHSRMSFDEEKRVSYLYTLLTLDTNISQFIEREREVCAMMAHVFDIIGDIHLFMPEEQTHY